MIMHIKTAPLRLMSSLILALSSAPLYAATWKLDDVVARHVEQTTPYFFYVGKGESWQDVQFSSQFNVQGSSTVIVRYDNQLIHQQNLSGKGTLNFSLPLPTAVFIGWISVFYKNQDLDKVLPIFVLNQAIYRLP